jgi:hypothetical protein
MNKIVPVVEESPDLERARAFLAREGLSLPPVPPSLAPHVREMDRNVFGTRDPCWPLDDLRRYVDEAAREPVEEYVLLGAAGRGLASMAVHLYAVTPAVAVFVQAQWANPYVDKEEARDHVQEVLDAAGRILGDGQAAVDEGRIPEGKRLVAVYSDFGTGWWGWQEVGPLKVSPPLCVVSGVTTLTAAIQALADAGK